MTIEEIKNAEYIPQPDKALFIKMIGNYISEEEREFFEKMAYKEEFECVASVDVIMDEDSNEEEIYILHQGIEEYEAGRGHEGNRVKKHVTGWNLSVFLQQDLFPLLGKHITILEWLRERNYKGINYNGSQD